MTQPNPWRNVVKYRMQFLLGPHADNYDIEPLTDAFIKQYGYIDIDQITRDEYLELIAPFALTPPQEPPVP